MALIIARSFLRHLPASICRDDIEQAAIIGLWNGLRRGKEAQPVYLRICIRGAILDELRRQDWLPRGSRKTLKRPLDALVLHFEETEQPETQWPSVAPSPEALAIEKAERDFLRSAIDGADLRARDRAVLLGHLEGLTLRQLAEDFGISEPRANQLYHRAVETVREFLARTTHPELRSLAEKDP